MEDQTAKNEPKTRIFCRLRPNYGEQCRDFGENRLEVHAHRSGRRRTDDEHECITRRIERPSHGRSARSTAKRPDLSRELMDHGPRRGIRGARNAERIFHIDEGEGRGRRANKKVVDRLLGLTANEARDSREPKDAATGCFAQDANGDPSGDAMTLDQVRNFSGRVQRLRMRPPTS
jgi:hypothetical protein